MVSVSLVCRLPARLQLPPGLLRSITWDQGTEMARHVATTEVLGTPVYFCDSRSPWQRGSNENTNGLRDWSPYWIGPIAADSLDVAQRSEFAFCSALELA